MYQMRLDEVFGALADPTRRRMVERLARGRRSIGDVAEGLPISQPAVSKHVKVLERSGLIRRSIDGRVHYLELAPDAMRSASAWLERQRKYWQQALDRLDVILSEEGA
ncbi:MAG TPA: metalloregulator ArsR/SmtB family transcription factor [Verrucomicrobiae bacterium]|nr:metalloregulator ArsR/SmtB family transcription factor [Verrucomicrobiae bacterium]